MFEYHTKIFSKPHERHPEHLSTDIDRWLNGFGKTNVTIEGYVKVCGMIVITIRRDVPLPYQPEQLKT